MATLTRDPTSFDTSAGSWNATTVGTINDYPDQTTYLTHGTTAGSATWNVSAPTVPADSTAITVRVYYYRYKSGAACNMGGRLKIGANYYNETPTAVTNNVLEMVTATWTNNPATSSAWTVNEANSIAAIGVNSTDANPAIRLYSIRLEVEYTEAGGTIYYESCAGALQPAGVMAKGTNRLLAGALLSSGGLLRKTVRALAGAFTSSGSLSRKTARALAGVLSTAGSVVLSFIGVLCRIDHEAGNLTQYTSLSDAGGNLSAEVGAALAGTDYGLEITV